MDSVHLCTEVHFFSALVHQSALLLVFRCTWCPKILLTVHCFGALVHRTSALRCTSSISVHFDSSTFRTTRFRRLVLKMGKTGAERLRESLERKKQKKKERNARFYSNNKDRILAKRKEQRRLKRPRVAEEDRDEGEARKPNWRLYKARQRARQKAEKETPLSKSAPVPSPNALRQAFPNRAARKRGIDTAKAILPRITRKKIAVVSSLIESPTTRQSLCGYVKSPENEEGLLIASSILQDATAAVQATNMKRKRSNDDLTATQVRLSFICGEKVSSKRLKSKVSKKLGINRKRLSTAFKHRIKTLRSDNSCWLYSKKRTRSDAVPAEHCKFAMTPGRAQQTTDLQKSCSIFCKQERWFFE